MNEKNLIGLCGPNVLEYLIKVNYKQYKKVTLFENDREVYDKIKDKIEGIPNVTLKCEDIGNHLHYKNTFYDLDFCATIGSIDPLLPKIGKLGEFSITLCLRKCSYEITKNLLKFYLNGKRFTRILYRDGAPMVTFLISQKNF